jgi:hypothetical protein
MSKYDAVVDAGGTFSPMHRFTDEAGNALQQADISAVTYTVYAVGPGSVLMAVAGHENVILTVGNVIFDELQTAPPWDTEDDAEGYNFRHTLDVSTNDAFPSWGALYMVVITVVVGGVPIIARWDVRTPKAPC